MCLCSRKIWSQWRSNTIRTYILGLVLHLVAIGDDTQIGEIEIGDAAAKAKAGAEDDEAPTAIGGGTTTLSLILTVKVEDWRDTNIPGLKLPLLVWDRWPEVQNEYEGARAVDGGGDGVAAIHELL
ncbi:hypothetical protein BDN72DRAFT_865480 [Pluteus cervinus]|uniref:Uncharacterized protein n=1 Tax=Pluteus cervinus TaxID=181527 RepID=A0ACD3A2A7_9AGAR|nr:hypothetical protein BDN72DRAFT_865480 [Pluteus cervinus]